MSAPKIVKRYANRKLYDTERSCYVTLDDIATMIKAGEEVKVVDNKSGEDLTSVTFAQIIFEAEKKKGFMPIGLLRDLIRDSGDQLSHFAKEQVETVQAKAHDIREQAQRIKTDIEDRIDRVIHKKDRPQHDEHTEEASEESKGVKQLKLLKEISELVESSQRTFEDVQKGLEDRIKGGVGTMSRYTSLGRDMEEMRKRLETLEQRLEKIQ